ncbi:substrate-binding domain-containing protein [Methanobacterium sp. SMA-27]|uniref:substrate-binding domain-containing protein n=1 Tax=Methanobacterium sp. SMA-27 TaxID=1495336 RepID=UPI00064E6635|nr:substrate-binding domain-containing protein [Methanobacterium sp. SMA-27]
MERNTKIMTALAVTIVAIVAIGAFAFTGGISGKQTLKIATTTSLEDTGLLPVLESAFEKKYPNIDVQFIAAGTGQALEYGKKGDVDLVMVHSKKQEEQFVADGYGTQRYPFAYNYFYIVGPANDPAKINGTNATTAFTNIREFGTTNPNQIKFVSRGDSSGTNTKEIALWNATGIDYNQTIRNQTWYVESGKGMGDTLTIADQKSAYTLSDSGTFLAYVGKLKLVPFVTKGKDLLNIYSLIPENTQKFPNVNNAAAMKWVDFVLSPEGQTIVGDYGKDKYGQQLFIPLAGQPEPTN